MACPRLKLVSSPFSSVEQAGYNLLTVTVSLNSSENLFPLAYHSNTRRIPTAEAVEGIRLTNWYKTSSKTLSLDIPNYTITYTI